MKRFIALGLAAFLVGTAAAAAPHLDSKLKAFLQKYTRGLTLGEDATSKVSVASVDLRGDGTKETLVYLRGERWCGSGGCRLLVLVPDGPSFKVISHTAISRPPIRVLPTRTHGWRDIGVTVHGGGTLDPYVAKLPFDGSGYAENPTVMPAERVKGSKGVVAISSAGGGEPLFP